MALKRYAGRRICITIALRMALNGMSNMWRLDCGACECNVTCKVRGLMHRHVGSTFGRHIL